MGTYYVLGAGPSFRPASIHLILPIALFWRYYHHPAVGGKGAKAQGIEITEHAGEARTASRLRGGGWGADPRTDISYMSSSEPQLQRIASGC